MSSINLSPSEKRDVQVFVETVQVAPEQDVDALVRQFTHGNRAAWQRFVVGTYNHPVTWWIGIFQLQMQAGMWGRERRAAASVRATSVSQALRVLHNEAGSVLKGDGSTLLSAIVRYNLKYRKADIVGRMLGGGFTNYASTGGRFGERRLSKPAKAGRWATNFAIASYGASIKAVAEGYRSADAIVQAILTGRPERLPAQHLRLQGNLTDEEMGLLSSLEAVLHEVDQLTNVAPQPEPISAFCARPENINLSGVCR